MADGHQGFELFSGMEGRLDPHTPKRQEKFGRLCGNHVFGAVEEPMLLHRFDQLIDRSLRIGPGDNTMVRR